MWGERKHSIGLHDHSLVRHIGLLKINSPSISSQADWKAFTDYIWPHQAYERVRRNREPGLAGFDGPSYFRKHFFLLDAGVEMFRGQDLDGGKQVARMLALPRKELGLGDDCDQVAAHLFVYDVLGRTSVCKFSSGTDRLGIQFLVAKHWGRREHANDDCLSGTWGELLRHGCIHFRQTRSHSKCLEPLVIPKEKAQITTVGMLDPVLDTLADDG